jgi:Brix domain
MLCCHDPGAVPDCGLLHSGDSPRLTLSYNTMTLCHPAPSQPAVLFVGERFESDADFKLARSLLLDMFRGQQVSSINLAGLDRVLAVFAAGSSERSLLLRQYRIAFKKSGTKVCFAWCTYACTPVATGYTGHMHPHDCAMRS